MNNDAKIAELLEMLAKEMKDGDDSHTKTPANFSTYTPMHGSGGIFTAAGLERDIVTAHMRPFGISSRLPLVPSVYLDPRFGAITGFTGVTGSQPDYSCQDAPVGYIKGCNLTARFGLKRFDTQTIDVDDVMLRLHRGDHTDLVLRGKLLGMTDLYPSGLSESDVLNIVTMSEMVIAAVNMERALAREIWQGVTTVAHEFPGLDVQIATGQKDADTGTLCPALDSDVKDFTYNNVCGSGKDIVEYLTTLMWYLNDVAEGTGLAPVDWVIAMRAGLWHELTKCWPCRYNTTGCTVIDTANIDTVPSIDAADMTAQRDAMRQGLYIDIEGRRYPVVLDVGIAEATNITNASVPRGSYASSIYVIPVSVTGGWPATYREHVDYRQAAADVRLLRGMEQFFWSDSGVWSWAYEQVKWCYKLALKTEQRVVLRVPHLAGRIDHILYTPLQHERERLDTTSAYFMDGGVSLRGGLSTPYAVWTSR